MQVLSCVICDYCGKSQQTSKATKKNAAVFPFAFAIKNVVQVRMSWRFSKKTLDLHLCVMLIVGLNAYVYRYMWVILCNSINCGNKSQWWALSESENENKLKENNETTTLEFTCWLWYTETLQLVAWIVKLL